MKVSLEYSSGESGEDRNDCALPPIIIEENFEELGAIVANMD